MTVQDGLIHVPKGRLEVTNPLAKKQEAKGLVPLTTKSGEIMWIHLDIVNDEQWESTRPKRKGKTYNVISLAQDDDAVKVASLSDSEEEKFAFAVQPATSQLWVLGLASGTYDNTTRPPTRLKPSKVCILQRPSKSLEVCKAGLPTSKDSSQIYQIVVNRSHD